MKHFKLSTTDNNIIELTKENFEKYTDKKAPYYWYKDDGRLDKSRNPVAVCPYCNNPIRIKNIYKNPDKIYAQHCRGSIQKLAKYNEDAYLNCSHANPNSHKYHEYTQEISPQIKEILTVLMNNFDKVISILSSEIDLRISDNLAEKILAHYLKIKGYTYKYLTCSNIIYMFAYRVDRFNIYGQYLLNNNSQFSNTIKNQETIKIINNQIQSENGYTKIEACFLHHDIKDNKLTYVVYNNDKPIYRKDIAIKPIENFSSSLPNNKLLNIAKKYIGLLLK